MSAQKKAMLGIAGGFEKSKGLGVGAYEPPLEGIFFFGGKNLKGECMNKLRYFKPVLIDGKIVHGEFMPIKILGSPPIGRFGHTMNYLPCLNSLLITGGKLNFIWLLLSGRSKRRDVPAEQDTIPQ